MEESEYRSELGLDKDYIEEEFERKKRNIPNNVEKGTKKRDLKEIINKEIIEGSLLQAEPSIVWLKRNKGQPLIQKNKEGTKRYKRQVEISTEPEGSGQTSEPLLVEDPPGIGLGHILGRSIG